MGGQQNEVLVRRVYEAFSAGDTSTLSQLFAPDIVWSVPGNSRISGEHKGQDAVLALFGLCGELSEGTLQVEPISITAQGDDRVIATHRVTAERARVRLDVTETEN